MKEKTDPERMLHAVEELSGEIHMLWQSLDEFRTDLIHELRNRYAETLNDPPEEQVVVCIDCESSLPSVAGAVQQGWTELKHDPKGISWSYAGVCGKCSAMAQKEPEVVSDTAPKGRTGPKKTLFPQDE